MKDTKRGILITAHGNPNTDWNEIILAAIEEIKPDISNPVEVGFGMWKTDAYNEAIEKLKAQNGGSLDELIVLPLLISDHSMVIDTQKYIFNIPGSHTPPFPIKKVEYQGDIQFLSAINYDSVISEILMDRAISLIKKAQEMEYPDIRDMELNLVMHGPNSESYNHLWLADGQRYASDLSELEFAEVNVITMRDDTDKEQTGLKKKWDRAKQIFRGHIEGAYQRNRVALILPILISKGGIENGILERVKGLNYVWVGETLFPDKRLGKYIKSKLT